MKNWRSLGCAALFWGFACGVAEAANWRAERLVDEFTDVETCRIEAGGPFARAMYRGLTGSFRTLHFFVENRSGEVRVGFMSEPLIPIPGDLQVRVDDNPLVTLTAADTPIDSGPTVAIPETPGLTPEARAAFEQSMRASMAVASPYRVLTGDRALDLLRQIIAGEDVRWRVVTVNAAASATGNITPRGLNEALSECGIAL